MGRPIGEINALAIRAFLSLPRELRGEALQAAADIARKRSPSAAFRDAIVIYMTQFGQEPYVYTTVGYGPNALAFAKLTRWLAVLRRDYGDDSMKHTVSHLTSLFQIDAIVIDEQMPSKYIRTCV